MKPKLGQHHTLINATGKTAIRIAISFFALFLQFPLLSYGASFTLELGDVPFNGTYSGQLSFNDDNGQLEFSSIETTVRSTGAGYTNLTTIYTATPNAGFLQDFANFWEVIDDAAPGTRTPAGTISARGILEIAILDDPFEGRILELTEFFLLQTDDELFEPSDGFFIPLAENVSPATVPEPATALLLGTGLLGLAGYRWHHRRRERPQNG